MEKQWTTHQPDLGSYLLGGDKEVPESQVADLLGQPLWLLLRWWTRLLTDWVRQDCQEGGYEEDKECCLVHLNSGW